MMNKEFVPAVVLASHNGGLGVIRSLGAMGIPVIAVYYQKIDMGYVSKYVKENLFTAHPENNELEFIDTLKNLSLRIGKSVLLPTDDETLSTVSKNKLFLEEYYYVSAPDWNTSKLFIDKKFTYKLADKINIPSPKTSVPYSIADIEEYISEAMFPVLVKPSQGHKYFSKFKRKMTKVNNESELYKAYTESMNAGIEVMLQELIPGDDTKGINYNSYFIEDIPVVEFTAEKVRLSPAGFGVPCVVKSSPHIAEVQQSAKKIINALGYNGFSCTEFKKDERDGKFKFMEVNGRHNRSSMLAFHCGLNFPYLNYMHLAYNEIPPVQNYDRDIYWIDEFKDIITTPGRIIKGEYRMIDFYKPYTHKKVYATFSRTDVKPFIKRFTDIIKIGIGSVFEKISRSKKEKLNQTEAFI